MMKIAIALASFKNVCGPINTKMNEIDRNVMAIQIDIVLSKFVAIAIPSNAPIKLNKKIIPNINPEYKNLRFGGEMSASLSTPNSKIK